MTEAQECPQLSQSPQQPPCSALSLRRSEAFSGAFGCKVPHTQHLIPPSQSFPPLQLGLERPGPGISGRCTCAHFSILSPPRRELLPSGPSASLCDHVQEPWRPDLKPRRACLWKALPGPSSLGPLVSFQRGGFLPSAGCTVVLQRSLCTHPLCLLSWEARQYWLRPFGALGVYQGKTENSLTFQWLRPIRL